jgi:hypothetical protein
MDFASSAPITKVLSKCSDLNYQQCGSALGRRVMTLRLAILCLLMISVSACGLITSSDSYHNPKTDASSAAARYGSVLGGEGGIDLLGGGKKPTDQGGTGIAVNSFLWRASLDTLSFMPLASADPFGGVIITDWYSPAEIPQERFKVNIFILDRQLRTDGLRAAVFHQRRGPNGDWADVAVETTTQSDLENTILTRARQLRVSTTAEK